MPTTLIHLSGGLDSTYVLYKHLSDFPSEKVLIHHVNLHHKDENRLNEELKAVSQITEWLSKNVSSNFIYHESSFDYGSLPRIAVKDIQVVSFFTAIILRTPSFNTIRKIKFGWHKGEVAQNEALRALKVTRVLKSLETREIQYSFPIADKSRKEMYNELPAELLALVKSCRKPHIYGGPCYECKTCKEYINENLKPL